MSRFRLFVIMSAFAGVVALTAEPLLRAQSEANTGSIRGTVMDPSGAVVPNAKVTAKQIETDYTREATTGPDGYYTLLLLPVGYYEVRVEARGFATLVRTNIPINVGRELLLIMDLKVGSAQQTVEVTTEAPMIESTRTQVSTVVDDTAVRNLPIHGRNYLDIALLTPGVVRDSNRGGDINFGGLKGTLNSLQIDGVDNNNNFFGQSLGRTGVRAPFQFSSEAVKEFQVKANSYSAEFGRAGGAVINVVTKSGTNALHGSVYDFYRDNRLNANKWELNRAGRPRPPLRIWQFGGGGGGPIVRDTAFWFFDYDSQRRKEPNPIICPFAPTNPLAASCTGAAADPIIGPRIQDYQRRLDQDVLMGKVDWRLRSNHNLSVRYNYQRFTGGGLENSGPLSVQEHTGDSLVHTHTLSGNLVSTLRPNLLNEFRLQWARDSEPGTANSTDPEADLRAGGTSFLRIGRNSFSPRETTIQRAEIVNNVSYLRGKNAFKFGGDINIERTLNFFPGNFGGSYVFASLAAFPNQPSTYTQAFAGTGTSGPETHPDITEYSGFFQDDYRASTELTLSMGLRYDLQTNNKPTIFNPDPQLTALGVNTGQMNTDTNNFGPRLGLAWAPRANRKIVVRGGYGLYYGRTPSILTATATSNNGLQVITITLPGNLLPPGFAFPATFAAPPAGATPATPNLYVFQPGYVQPYVHQASVGMDYELAPNWVVGGSYLLVRGRHLTVSNDINLSSPVSMTFPITTGGSLTVERFPPTRPAPNFFRITQFQSNASSSYDALVLTLNKRMSRHFQAAANYTLSWASDDVFDFTAVVPFVDDSKLISNPKNPSEDYGRSDQDIRNRFVAFYVWDLDYFNKHPNFFARNVLGQWSFSGILQLQNGKTWSTHLGGDPNNDSNRNTDRAVGISRNSNTLPHQESFDIRLERDFPIRERARAQFMFEAFNLFNHPNFSSVTDNQFNFATANCPGTSPCFFPVSAFGTFQGTYDQPSGGSGTPGPGPRTLQLGLKFTW